MMTFNRLPAGICLLIASAILPACGNQTKAPVQREKSASETFGKTVTRLTVHVGSIWGGGYSIDVVPEEYAVIKHRSCPSAKEPNVPLDIAEGFCVVRITKEQSTRFETAMDRFKRNAIPLENYSPTDPYLRPDGKPCKSQWTDSTLVSLLWTGTEGVRIATFYEGCDREEFDAFYKSVLAVTDPLPIQQIIEKR